MGTFDHDDALLVAASEVTPAEWRDLSDLLERAAGKGATLSACLSGEVEAGDLADYIAQALGPEQVRRWEDQLESLSHCHPDVWMTSVGDADYPENLGAVYDRPPFLFIKGALAETDCRAMAIVGSRDCGSEVLEAAALLAESAARAQVTVVSGLARGVDAAAHAGALSGGGRTLAVLGTGIDRLYPPEHAHLADQIVTQGAVLSQFRPGSPGTKSSFPVRNAVISGLSLVNVLMDAGERSGTRSEAEAALRHRRGVLLWKPALGRKPWANDWVSCGEVEWAESVEDVLAAVEAASPT